MLRNRRSIFHFTAHAVSLSIQRSLFRLTAALCLAVVCLAASHSALAAITPLRAALNTLNCEGTACSQVTLSWDEAKQHYDAQNNSNRRVWVEASNLGASARVLVSPHETGKLLLRSIVSPYRANYE